MWWRRGHGQWETLTGALANPKDYDAYAARDRARRVERDTARKQEQQQWGASGGGWVSEPPAPATVLSVSVSVSVSCEGCGRPVTGSQDPDGATARPDSGHYCPECHIDTEPQPYPPLRQALFSRPRH